MQGNFFSDSTLDRASSKALQYTNRHYELFAILWLFYHNLGVGLPVPGTTLLMTLFE